MWGGSPEPPAREAGSFVAKSKARLAGSFSTCFCRDEILEISAHLQKPAKPASHCRPAVTFFSQQRKQ